MSKKEETIIIGDYVYPKKTSAKFPKEKLYFEKTSTIKPEYRLDKNDSPKEQFNKLLIYFKTLKSGVDKIIRDYLFLKMYKYVAIRDEYYNKDVFTIEKHINKLKGDYSIMEKYITMLFRKDILTENELDEMYGRVIYLSDFIEGLTNDISEFKKKHYKEFKMPSYFVIQDKTCKEIEEIIALIDGEIMKFKSIHEASDYYVYNSGQEISEAINELLKINQKGIVLDYHYFIKNDAIISFTYHEWIDLMTKFRYVFSKIKGKVELSKEFKELYKQIEVRFAIILIAKEL